MDILYEFKNSLIGQWSIKVVNSRRKLVKSEELIVLSFSKRDKLIKIRKAPATEIKHFKNFSYKKYDR